MSSTSIPRPRAAVLALAAAAVTIAGCSTTTGISASTTGSSSSGSGTCSAVSIGMRSGSVPAPHNYQWSTTVQGDRGTITAQGGDRGAQEWNREFTADAPTRQALCAYARELAGEAPADGVGGATAHAEFTPEGGDPVSGQQGVDGAGVPERMAAALPAGEWTALDEQLEAWSNS